VLRCEDLVLAVPGRVLARGLAFEARRGELWAVLGANGSGKTTLVHALAGLSPAAGGRVLVDGAPLEARGGRERARLVGVLLQHEEAAFYGTALEYALLGRFPHAPVLAGWRAEDEQAARAALAALGLEPVAARAVATLSGGERQRVRLAQLVAQDPELLLLDEPLQHLDLRHQRAVLELLRALARERARCVVAVLHDALWAARFCSHALLVYEGGEIEHGPAGQVLTRGRLERLYGCPLREVDGGGQPAFVPVI
jgi:iron complex transport system ATP-binding protein